MTPDLLDLKTDAPTDARQIRSRKALHAALLSLLTERPFDQLTVREITKRAGTGYATFFRHFQTREALLADIAIGQISELLDLILPTLRHESGEQAIHRLCTFVEENESLWRALLTGGAADIVRAQVLRQARTCSDRVSATAPGIPAELALTHAVSATIEVLAWWLRATRSSNAGQVPDASTVQAPDQRHDAMQVASILQRMVVAPVIGDSAPPAA
ncbi:TetR/AcrR family transcriptional regulator [Novosphingobium sp. YJ-S2-02]|uniref:TetR/AcrR family transcriptional regulator n=1 Tax=Novosphingobium aureum TaxID=2792964 RepID=A0A931HEZ0_9SPHN|nr:TetR/AcrR family transcriptional regulator [Novosphingobium aureum]MBH0114183.1 TetR/AcrR family transcriptional regulator [Novosphingobium aureum]